MSTYSYEERLEAVLRVVEEGMSYEASAKVLETAQCQVQRWVSRYEKYGTEGLLLHNGTYTGEFKQHVIYSSIRDAIMFFFLSVRGLT